jgi:hypothetical protein
MSRCLRDRTLWLLSEGEASREDRAHVASCIVCAARLHRLEQDLSQLRAALAAPVLPRVTPTPLRTVGVRWVMAASAFAALLMMAWVGMWWQHPSAPTLPLEARQESFWPFIEGVSAALFTIVDAGAISKPEPLPDLDDMQAALVGGWPCDGQALVGDVVCEDETFALLLGGQ